MSKTRLLQRTWRIVPPLCLREPGGRQSSPYIGKLTARPAGKPGDSLIVKGEFATIPSTPPFGATAPHTGCPECVFPGMAESIWSDGVKPKTKVKPSPGAGAVPPPAGRPRAQLEEPVGSRALAHRPQVSSGRLFLDRVGRNQSPSPLRRRDQTTTLFPRRTSEPEPSTLLGTGTFYFALTPGYHGLQRTSARDTLEKPYVWERSLGPDACGVVVCPGGGYHRLCRRSGLRQVPWRSSQTVVAVEAQQDGATGYR
jgi:hypothetical protein